MMHVHRNSTCHIVAPGQLQSARKRQRLQTTVHATLPERRQENTGPPASVLDSNISRVTATSREPSQQQLQEEATPPQQPPQGSDSETWGAYFNNTANRLLSTATSYTNNLVPFKRKTGSIQETTSNTITQQTVVPSASTAAPDVASINTGSRGLTLLFRKRAADSAAPAVEEPPRPSSNHEVLKLLQQRYEQGSKPGQRTDDFKLGLVVEGGGMRGAVTGGALMALLDLELKGCFDAVYGSSAGAINATYFLSEQTNGVRIYHEDIANKEFVDLNRLMKGPGPVLNLDMLLHDVMHYVKPLDWDAVLASPVPLKVVASSLDKLEAVILEDFEDKDDLLCCLRSTANIPAICGPPVWHRGQRLVDAAVFEAIPFRSAIADGCTHVLTLCSRPPPRFGTLMNSLEDALGVAVKRAVLSPEYMRPAWRREMEIIAQEGSTHDQQLLMGLRPDHPELPFFSGSHVCPMYPGDAAKFAPVCIDPVVLKAGVDEGYDTVMKVVAPVVRSDLGFGVSGLGFGDAEGLGRQLQMAR